MGSMGLHPAGTEIGCLYYYCVLFDKNYVKLSSI